MNSAENVDLKELDKFAAFAAHWWDLNGEMRALHQLNPVRFGYIKEKSNIKDNSSVIDVGCGGGIITESFARESGNVTGIDLNKSLIEVAKLHLKESGLKVDYYCIAAETLAEQQKNQFDVVTCLELLEHVPDPCAIIRACATLAKPGGHLFFSTLNRNFKSYLLGILAAEYIMQLIPKKTHDYAKFIRPHELNAWLIDAGLKPKEIKGFSYHPFSKHFSLTDDISINYIFYAKKPI